MKEFDGEKMWRKRPLKDSYEVLIIGAGVHGLAIAYYLGKQGITDIAVLEKGYLGCGNSGRNTAIVRSNYRTPEGVKFYDESLHLYENLSQELNYNLLLSQEGHLTLAHTDSAIHGLRVRAENNRILGVDSRIIYPEEIKRLVPAIDVSERPRYPIMAALYHPPGGIIRHDAVIWGYARGNDQMGIEIHPHVEVQSIDVHEGAIQGISTSKGKIKTDTVVNATSGWCSTIAKMAGLELPIESHQLQACVTEPLKPFLDKVIVSANLHVYISQTDRGELVIGAEIDPYSSYSMFSTLPTLEMIAGSSVELFPCINEVHVLRQWAGVCDMSPDYSPIIGPVEELKGFVLDVGWGTYGFKAGPVAGKNVAEYIATGKMPDVLKPFMLSRFYEDRLVGEKAAAAVSH